MANTCPHCETTLSDREIMHLYRSYIAQKRASVKSPGRPYIAIDWVAVGELQRAGKTITEISRTLGINRTTLKRRLTRLFTLPPNR